MFVNGINSPEETPFLSRVPLNDAVVNGRGRQIAILASSFCITVGRSLQIGREGIAVNAGFQPL